MRRPNPCLLLVPGLFLLMGCVKPRFTYEVDAAFPSGSYRTLAPDPRQDRVIIREGMRPLHSGPHLRAVLAGLEAHKYRSVPPEEADLWVAVYVLTEGPPEGDRGGSGKPARREGTGEGHRGGGHGGKSGGAPTAGKQMGAPREAMGGRGGTVIVQLQDRKTGLVMWQGEANLKSAEGALLTEEEAMRQLLRPLPVHP